MHSLQRIQLGVKLVVAGLLLVFGVTAKANLIQNGSFETPILPIDACSGNPNPCSGTFQNFTAPSSFDSWSVVGAGTMTLVSNDFNQLGFTFPAQDGSQWADMSGIGANDPVGVQQQVATVVDEFYDLTFWIGNTVGGLFGATSTIEVLINDTLSLGLFENDDGGLTTDWEQFSVSFQATSTLSTIAFFNRDPITDNMNGLDNIILTAQSSNVPEPSTLFLLIAGVLGLGFARRLQS